MPSDSKKREQARKKEAQKNRNKKIATVASASETNGTTNGTTNGITNGTPVELTEEGTYHLLISFHSMSRCYCRSYFGFFFIFSFRFFSRFLFFVIV